MNSAALWGIHMGAHVADRPIEGNYVAIGWPEVGDASIIGKTREDYKSALQRAYPEKKPGAIPVDAGTIFKFVHEVKAGDGVVYPSKNDRLVNIGRFTGVFTHAEDDPDGYPNRQGVNWVAHIPRSEFSQSALHEIGSFVTLFRVKRHRQEFLAKIGASDPVHTVPDDSHDEEIEDDDSATVLMSRQAEETTEDFVIRRVMSQLDGYQFEELVAHLLSCMGYTTRVTQRSGDGGVDVIAHMDALGFQPPIVKVQCKRTTSQHGPAEVNQLLGTLGEGEFGLFVSLGSFSRAATDLERNRPKLRLLDGEGFVDMLLQNYNALSPRYRSLVPLKQIHVPDLPD